ncbi:hypothetical protein HHK36_000849 [Tetracentron sinense]|uniref:PWWP domain-containing protein n=1 Tax=Tetracentron sinense TaxID=13715 RepID=A0A835DUD8_TETSI|nr:hypothetical protein HHK36_000849 [Tetracentron sinense]
MAVFRSSGNIAIPLSPFQEVEQGSGGVDCSVGSIVWVRRRNGAWWPGKILGPNELSASHLMSPRSGTPVKLLGREDASVDWYNLEKSKRVKAFRCGEFDDCIERAESSQGIPIKKREKYARREDAILHALELEKQQREKKQRRLGISTNCSSSKMPGALKKEFMSSESLGNYHDKFGNRKSQVSKRLDSSLQDERMGNPLYGQKVKQGKQPSWEDDNSEVIPRMKGLQDFGLRIAPSKRKLSSFVAVDNNAHVLPSGGHSMTTANHVSNCKGFLSKTKRSQGGLTEESLVKRRDRRRPLVQVLQSSTKLTVAHSLQSDGDAVSISMPGEEEHTQVICRAKRSRCLYLPAESNDCLNYTDIPSDQMQMSPSQIGMDNSCLHNGSLTEENTSSGLRKDSESDSSERDYLDMHEETTVLLGKPEGTRSHAEKVEGSSKVVMDLDADATIRTPAEKTSGRYGVQGKPESMSSEEPDELAPAGYMSHLHPHDQTAAAAADMGISKWQLKGKRNIRNLVKRPMEVTDGKGSYRSIHGTYFEGLGYNPSQRVSRQGSYHSNEELNYGYDEDDLIEKDFRTQMVGFGDKRYPLMLKAASKDRSRFGPDITDSDEHSVWEAHGLSQSALRGYWEDPGECFEPTYFGHHLGNGVESILIDVDLKVQASYKGEHVPLVSLMSRLNGKAIIGHPVQIEALEDGSSNILLSTNEDFGDEAVDNDGNSALPPVWRTARRSAMHRVPRPHPSALEGNEAADSLVYSSGHESKPLCKKPTSTNLGNKAMLIRNGFPEISRPPTEHKFPRKLLKKVSLPSQKTRTLSSIAIEHKLGSNGGEPKLASKSCIDELIKTEEIGPTTVSCIPVKLVFSRLLEAVSRPPSRAAESHGALMKVHTERK